MVSLALLSACAQGPVMRGRVKGLEAVVDQAEKNGARRCAPRELALAKAHLEFASVELAQGEMQNAETHLQIAEPNAKAALDESPPDKCSERGFVEAKPGDRDGDGIPDAEDKCPDNPENYNGFEDDDGCPDDPDTDNDRIADSKDNCVTEPEDHDGYLDDDGCPDTDNDADGNPDVTDKCPNQPEDVDGWQDDDGCPDFDNDSDTVQDVDDLCPNTPGDPGGERPGCPKKDQLAVITASEIRILDQIQFEFNRAALKRENKRDPHDSRKILGAVAQILKDNPNVTLEVQGHTDNVGNPDYNQKLSQARAETVRKYLVSKGIAPNRLTARGYGMSQPIVPNTTEENRAINRRVQFIRTEQKSNP
jgi:outer membrane protein OmpA-like peptidoglycan-associated protein